MDPAESPFQLLEGEEYRFEVRLPALDEPITLQPAETITLDAKNGRAGRLRPGLHTGQLTFSVLLDDASYASADLEIRARKLQYRQEYRWMLRDIADSAAELVMERFAASSQRFLPEGHGDALTRYQQFEFLRALFDDEAFQAATQRVLARPYISWVHETVLRPLSAGLPSGPRAQRALMRPGERVLTPSLQVPAAPKILQVDSTTPSLDNAPNQFLKYVFTRWRSLALDVGTALEREGSGAPVSRGLREVSALREAIDALLGAELFREVGDMTRFPAENQVLQKREGYRDILRAFLQAEIAAQLSWDRQSDSFHVGQRNVATLYEFWVFVRLAEILAEICGSTFSLRPLLVQTPDGFAIQLRRGREKVLSGEADVGTGRKIHIELWFNRRFGRERGAWARPMQPDCSVLLSPASDESSHFEPVWLHFDAKYRIEEITQLFGPVETPTEGGYLLSPIQGVAKGDDLLKMHAYRDAIKRSAGAYVVYPGSTSENIPQYQELLPGLGAFTLRPLQEGGAAGRESIRDFLVTAIEHISEQVSQHERARFWTARAYDTRVVPVGGAPHLTPLRHPPADTLVLLSYVKSDAHLGWIRDRHLYNLRGGHRTGAVALESRELSSELLFLYGSALGNLVEIWRIVGRPLLASRESMVRDGYPRPQGAQYFCLPLEGPLDVSGLLLTREQLLRAIEAAAPEEPLGRPVVMTLDSLWRATGVASAANKPN